MDLKRELTDYEIGGIGDIKKHTLRFHSYRIGTEDGKLTIFAEYAPGQFPKVYKGYPSGQELLIELCNLNLELRNKSLEECARILIRWSLENIHPYYRYGDTVSYIEFNGDGADGYWDMMVNVLECYRAVSYTHLQHHASEGRSGRGQPRLPRQHRGVLPGFRCAAEVLRGPRRGAVQNRPRGNGVVRRHGPGPVSYTHLIHFRLCYISQANNKPGESLIAFSRFVVLFPVLSAPYPAAHPNNADPRR